MLKIMSASSQTIDIPVSGFEVLQILVERHPQLEPEIEALMDGADV